MSKQIIELANVIWWHHEAGTKVYIEAVDIAVELFPFHNRQVFVRFARGPAFDLSIWEMDQIVSAYQALRESTPLSQRKAAKPDPCDFTVPFIATQMKGKK